MSFLLQLQLRLRKGEEILKTKVQRVRLEAGSIYIIMGENPVLGIYGERGIGVDNEEIQWEGCREEFASEEVIATDCQSVEFMHVEGEEFRVQVQ